MKKYFPLLFLGFFFFAAHAHAAITFDASTTLAVTNATVGNKSITIGSGSNEALIIEIGGRCGSSAVVTVGGNNATFVASSTNINANYQFYYLGLPAGSVSVTSTCVTTGNWGMSLASFFGVNQTTPVDSTSTQTTGNNTPPSNTVTTTVANDLLVDSIGYQVSSSTPSAGQTSITNGVTGGTCGSCEGLMASYKIATTPQNYTMNWTINTAQWSDNAIAFEPYVETPPSISSFSASPMIVASSGASMLSWNVTNASSVAITPGAFSTSTLIGSTTMYPTSTTTYTLTATNPGGTATSTATVTVDSIPPTTPSGLTATSTITDVSLSWTASTDSGGSGLAGYNIFRCVGASCTPTIKIGTSSVPSYNDDGLATSTTYTYAVSAYDGVGNVSATSTSVSAITTSYSGNVRSLNSWHFAWNDDIGWINFYSTMNVIVTNSQMTGYANSFAGYISLDCGTSPSCNICSTSRYGISNNGSGDLSGWAWNDTYGWISFCGNSSGGSVWNGSSWVCPSNPTYEVTINPSTGVFDGWAWNNVIGWISFNCTNTNSCGTSQYFVQTLWAASGISVTGTLDSQTFDTGVSSGAQINSITWQGLEPASTTVGFQIAVSNASSGPWSYAGPDGTSSSTYTGLAGIPITLNNYPALNGRYFRYRVILTTNQSQTVTPRVTDIVVNWSP